MADTRIAITSSKNIAFNTPIDEPAQASSTSTVANTAEQFKYSPKASAFVLKGTVASANGNVKYAIFAGTDKSKAKKVISGEFAEGKTQSIQIDTMDLVDSDGTITIEAVPATAGKKLFTDCAFTISAEEFISIG